VAPEHEIVDPSLLGQDALWPWQPGKLELEIERCTQ